MLNMVIFQGRPTTEPETLLSKDGKTRFAEFKIAVNRFRGKNLPAETVYVPVISFNRIARYVGTSLAKGALCTIVGRLIPDRKDKRREFLIEVVTIYVHENLRNDNMLRALTLTDDPADEAILPKGMVKDLFDTMEITEQDEDMPV